MNKQLKFIVIPFLALSLLACVPKDSALKDQNFEKLAEYIYDEAGIVMSYNPCGLSWAHPEKSNEAVKGPCDVEAFKLAEKLSQNGFGELTSEDIYYPEFWKFYAAYRTERKAKQKPFEMPKW